MRKVVVRRRAKADASRVERLNEFNGRRDNNGKNGSSLEKNVDRRVVARACGRLRSGRLRRRRLRMPQRSVLPDDEQSVEKFAA